MEEVLNDAVLFDEKAVEIYNKNICQYNFSKKKNIYIINKLFPVITRMIYLRVCVRVRIIIIIIC